jgi:hypothetical protein
MTLLFVTILALLTRMVLRLLNSSTHLGPFVWFGRVLYKSVSIQGQACMLRATWYSGEVYILLLPYFREHFLTKVRPFTGKRYFLLLIALGSLTCCHTGRNSDCSISTSWIMGHGGLVVALVLLVIFCTSSFRGRCTSLQHQELEFIRRTMTIGDNTNTGTVKDVLLL